MRQLDLSVYLVLDAGLGPQGMADVARAAVKGGVRTVQLRMKDVATAERIAAGRLVQAALAGSGAGFVVNDDVAAAVALGADGLHVGQGDTDVRVARARIGPDMALGLSVETVAQARAVDPAVVDHAGAGPVFGTPTKPDAAAPVGFDGLTRIVAACPVPCVAIGGLKRGHVEAVLAAGAVGLAVVSEICADPDPAAAARRLADAVATRRQT